MRGARTTSYVPSLLPCVRIFMSTRHPCDSNSGVGPSVSNRQRGGRVAGLELHGIARIDPRNLLKCRVRSEAHDGGALHRRGPQAKRQQWRNEPLAARSTYSCARVGPGGHAPPNPNTKKCRHPKHKMEWGNGQTVTGDGVNGPGRRDGR